MNVSRVDVIVLGVLAAESRYGYELLEHFRELSMEQWADVGKASVYQALRRLEERGFLIGRAQEGDEGPDRRVYRVTRSGRDRLRAGVLERFGEADLGEAALALGSVRQLSVADSRRGLAERQRALAERRRTIADGLARLSTDDVAARMLRREDAFVAAEQAWLSSFARDLAKLRR